MATLVNEHTIIQVFSQSVVPKLDAILASCVEAVEEVLHGLEAAVCVKLQHLNFNTMFWNIVHVE